MASCHSGRHRRPAGGAGCGRAGRAQHRSRPTLPRVGGGIAVRRPRRTRRRVGRPPRRSAHPPDRGARRAGAVAGDFRRGTRLVTARPDPRHRQHPGADRPRDRSAASAGLLRPARQPVGRRIEPAGDRRPRPPARRPDRRFRSRRRPCGVAGGGRLGPCDLVAGRVGRCDGDRPRRARNAASDRAHRPANAESLARPRRAGARSSGDARRAARPRRADNKARPRRSVDRGCHDAHRDRRPALGRRARHARPAHARRRPHRFRACPRDGPGAGRLVRRGRTRRPCRRAAHSAGRHRHAADRRVHCGRCHDPSPRRRPARRQGAGRGDGAARRPAHPGSATRPVRGRPAHTHQPTRPCPIRRCR